MKQLNFLESREHQPENKQAGVQKRYQNNSQGDRQFCPRLQNFNIIEPRSGIQQQQQHWYQQPPQGLHNFQQGIKCKFVWSSASNFLYPCRRPPKEFPKAVPAAGSIGSKANYSLLQTTKVLSLENIFHRLHATSSAHNFEQNRGQYIKLFAK